MSETTATQTTETAATATAEPDVMAMAAQADAGTLSESKPTPPAQEPEMPAEQGSAEKPKGNEAAEPKTTEDTKPAKPESEFTKKQKEAARLSESWKKLEIEKEALRREKAELEAQRKAPAQPAKPEKKSGPQAEDYEALAKQYEEEGNERLAKAARDKAQEMRAAEQAETRTAGTAAKDPFDTPEFQTQWQKNAAEAVQADPELAKPNSPLVAAANALCSHQTYGRFFRAHPDGIKMAVEVAKLQRDAAKASELTTQIAGLTDKLTKANAEVARLTKLTSLSGSQPGVKPTGKAITDMSASDAEQTVLELARAADRGEI